MRPKSKLLVNCFGTADFKEGTTAFLEKRKAEFPGEHKYALNNLLIDLCKRSLHPAFSSLVIFAFLKAHGQDIPVALQLLEKNITIGTNIQIYCNYIRRW